MTHTLSTLAVGFLVVLTGCVSTTYHWGNYERALYKQYKNPDELDYLAEQLVIMIERGEQTDRVPPGIYAEYGYVLLEQGDGQNAIGFFQREKTQWPESACLMDRMIETARIVEKTEPPAEEANDDEEVDPL